MAKNLNTFKERLPPILFSTAIVAGILGFLSSITSTLLGGLIDGIPRTPRDETLLIIYLTPLVILVPSCIYFAKRPWQKIRTLDKLQKQFRIYKLASLIIIGACAAMLTRILIRLQFRIFDHELPAAGVLSLFGSFCFMELLKSYSYTGKERSEEMSIKPYLWTATVSLVGTVSLIIFLISSGKIR